MNIKRVVLEIDNPDGINCYELELTADKLPKLWILYNPESTPIRSSNDQIHSWIRQSDYVHLSEQAAMDWLHDLLGYKLSWKRHELFTELLIGFDGHSNRWILEPIPIKVL